ncbi:MAG: hypothetical protein ACD_23C01388G0005 [uncultured bacterium]|nr:MAG: hypothetical protein ACD_23C01388G0005 [uncultured bacterium]
MNKINTPSPPQSQNPLVAMQELQTEVVEALRDLFAEQEAMRGLLKALATTHPEPKRLAESYLMHMDSIAETVHPERIERYRTAAQQWRDLLLDCANQRPLP